MASYRLTRLLEEKLVAAQASLRQMTRDLLTRADSLQSLIDTYKIQLPILAFDPDRKVYLPNGRYRIMIAMVAGEIYTLEDLNSERYVNRDLISYQMEIRSGAREIWVEYGNYTLSSNSIAQFPKQIFNYLTQLIEQILAPEIEAANTVLYQKLEALLRKQQSL